jgi:hypothetical protein
MKVLPVVFVCVVLVVCIYPATSLLAQQRTAAQPEPANESEFSKWGYTWHKDVSPAPGGGTFVASNVQVDPDQVVLTLNEYSDGNSEGAEIATLTSFQYGTYTFTYWQDVVESGSVASGFSYINNSQTEIDVEQTGQYPGTWYFTNWLTTARKQWSLVGGYPATYEHTVKYVWVPGKITWYLDGTKVAVHTENIPSHPAPFLFNFWGTNSPLWGGVATPGTRHMIITGFSFKPLN